MKSKTLFAAVLCFILCVLCAVGPTSVGSALGVLEEGKLAATKNSTYAQNLNTMEMNLLSVVNEYNESRDFDIFYGDVENLLKIFSGLSGVEVQSVTVVDPMDYYKDVMPWSEGVEHSAVKFTLVVVDANATINAITRMQLPVQNLYVEFPSKVTLTILTGGAV